jgi:hypothetical protein
VELFLQVTDPWEFGDVTFMASVDDRDLEAAAFPDDSLRINVEGDLSLNQHPVSIIEITPRHVEYPLSVIYSGETISVNGVVLEPSAPVTTRFIADARRADH